LIVHAIVNTERNTFVDLNKTAVLKPHFTLSPCICIL
jgi:hypothetical protein